MNSIGLEKELAAAAMAVQQQHLDRLVDLGVSIGTIAEMGLEAPPFGVMTATVAADGTFEPGPGAAFIAQPVFFDRDLIDIVAWRTLWPARWHLRRGVAWALGAEQLAGADLDAPLRVSATPLDWLRGDGRGICVLDWSAPELRDLILVDAIEVDDRAFGEHLLNRISRPPRVPTLITRRAAACA